MPSMSRSESWFCRSRPWQVASAGVLGWATQHTPLRGDVLEIGSGSGSMGATLARAHPGARLTLMDYDPAMVAAAQKRVQASGRPVEVRQGNAAKMPFEPARFDTVTSFLMLHHVIDWEAAIGEVARVLKPGGTLIGYDLLDTVAARAVHHADRSPFRLYDRDALARQLHHAGFVSPMIEVSLAGHVARFKASLG